MKFIDKEHQMLVRDEWLSERGLDEHDVMIDGEGREYVYQEGEEEMEVVYLPVELEKIYVPF